MNKTYLYILLFFGLLSTAQTFTINGEQFPKFKSCETLQAKVLEDCFYNNVQEYVYNNFKIEENLKDYSGTVIVLFEVTDAGKFKVIYVDANEKALITESNRVFESMPIISPPTFNGKPTYAKYTIKIAIPLKSPTQIAQEQLAEKTRIESGLEYKRDQELKEFDNIVYKNFNKPQFESHLNLQFSHALYSQFDAALNQVGSNNHTGSKPFSYAEVGKYYDLSAAYKKLEKPAKGWWGKKFWNENLVEIQGDGYWFTFNPIVD